MERRITLITRIFGLPLDKRSRASPSVSVRNPDDSLGVSLLEEFKQLADPHGIVLSQNSYGDGPTVANGTFDGGWS
jgi:hypothetical protein